MGWSRRRVAEWGMVLGTLPWLVLTLMPRSRGHASVHLVPFSDIALLWGGSIGYFLVQVVGNLLVFAALGFLLPVRFAAFASVWRVLAVAAVASLAIEVVQLVSVYGRTFSVDDIMLNAVGAALAAVLSRRWWASREPVAVAADEYGV